MNDLIVVILITISLGGCTQKESRHHLQQDIDSKIYENTDHLASVSLHIAPHHWEQLVTHLHEDIEVPVQLAIDHSQYPEAKLELQGYSSRHFEKKNFKLKLRAPISLGIFDQVVATDRVILKGNWKDHSMLREALAWYALEQLGYPVPAYGWVNLHINEEDFGLYFAVEAITHDFLIRQGYQAGGELYKAVNQRGSFAPNIPLSEGFEKKHGDLSDWTDLERLATTFRNLMPSFSIDQVSMRLIQGLDLSRLIDHIAWMAYGQCSDSATQNYYLYNEGTLNEPQWSLINWDLDISFSAFWRTEVLARPFDEEALLHGKAYWARQLTSARAVRIALTQRLNTLLDGPFSPQIMMAYFEELVQRLEPWIARDLQIWNRRYSVEEVLTPIYDFIEGRPEYLRSQMATFIEDDRHVE